MRRSSWPTLDRYTAPVRTWIWIMHDSFPSCPCSSFSRARSRAVLSSMNFRRHSDVPSKSRQNCMSAYPRMVFIVVLIVSRPHCIIFPPLPSPPPLPVMGAFTVPQLFLSRSCYLHVLRCGWRCTPPAFSRPSRPASSTPFHIHVHVHRLPFCPSTIARVHLHIHIHAPSHPIPTSHLYPSLYLFPSDTPRARSTAVFCVSP